MLTADPVSKDNSNVRNNGPHLVEPVRLEEPPGTEASDQPDAEPRLF